MADRFRSSIIELGAALSTEWNRFWFTPAPARRLAVVRSLAGGLGLLLAWSWAGDLIAWFGPDGIVSPEVLTAWRSPTGLSLFDAARSSAAVWAFFLLGVVLLGMLAVGAMTPIAAPLAGGFLSGAIRAGRETTTNRAAMLPERFGTDTPTGRAKLDAVEKLVGVADEAGLTLIQLALGFVTAHPGVTSAIVGPRTVEHLHSQLAAADTVLPADVLDRIDEIVAPGVDLAPDDKFDTPPALLDASLRRR